MWMDVRGVANTVALPEPSMVMSEEFRNSLAALASSESEAIVSMLDSLESRIYASLPDQPDDPDAESQFVGVSPPQRLLTGSVLTVDGLRSALERTDSRWRLDAVCAVADYIE